MPRTMCSADELLVSPSRQLVLSKSYSVLLDSMSLQFCVAILVYEISGQPRDVIQSSLLRWHGLPSNISSNVSAPLAS